MSCGEFESRLLEDGEWSAEAGAHAESCGHCGALLEELRAVDADLLAAYGGAEVSRGFRESVLRRAEGQAPLRRPSFLPEILDFVGWSAVVVLVVYVLDQLRTGSLM